MELFEKYEDIKDWFLKVALLDEKKDLENLEEKKKNIYFSELIEYRTLLKKSFNDYFESKIPFSNLISRTNEILLNAKVHPKIKLLNDEYIIEYSSKEKDSNKLLVIIAIEVMSLLNSKDAKYIKKCNNHTCSLLFVDTSKNHSRRWCSMETCGNRSKVNSFAKRKKLL